MNLDFSAVEVTEKVSKPTIKAYTIQDVTISGVVEGKSKNGNDQIEIGFVNSVGEEHVEKMSLSAGAMKYTMMKIKHMMTKVISEDDANKVNTVEGINTVLTGQKMRIKFGSREFQDDSGNLRQAAQIGLPTFAEVIVEGRASGLKLNDKYDLKKLEKAPDLLNTSIQGENNQTVDFPFNS